MATPAAAARVLRAQAVEALGGACLWCGETDPVVLCFDHVNGDGHKDKTKGGLRRYGPSVYRRVLRGQHGFQLLCANCNLRKARLHGEFNGRPKLLTPDQLPCYPQDEREARAPSSASPDRLIPGLAGTPPRASRSFPMAKRGGKKC